MGKKDEESKKEDPHACPHCDFVNSSGNEADLNFHMSTNHPQEWKEKQEKINKGAEKYMKDTYGKDYKRTKAQREPKQRR